jgi:hypothetical protein
MPACGSPKLIAACHVLHRLLLPRHPPCALSSLTTKFTQHTRDRSQLSAISFQLKTFPNTPRKLYGPNACSSRAQRLSVLSRPSRLNSGTHKNLQRLVICPIYSVVKYRPRVERCWLLALSFWLKPFTSCVSLTPPERVWVLLNPESCKPQIASNPMFDAKLFRWCPTSD